MKILEARIKTLEPLIIGFDSSNESRDIISGTAIRGLFIKENFKDFEDKKEKLILSKDIIFTDAYLVENQNYFIPAPKSFLCDKHKMKELKSNEVKEIDLLNGDTNGESLGNKFVLISKDSLQINSINKKEKMHINKNIKEGEGSLYRYEAIEKGQEFSSLIFLKDEKLETLLKKIEGKKLLGKSKFTGYGRVEISLKEIEKLDEYREKLNLDEKKSSGNLEIYFFTDTILKDKHGNSCSFLPKDELEELFKVKDIKIEKRFISNKIVGGYNSFQKLPLPKEVAIEAGSIVRISYSGELTEEKIREIEERGLGYFRERGYGRVFINPSFNQGKVAKFVSENKRKKDKEIPKENPKKVIDSDEKKMLEILKRELAKKRVVKESLEKKLEVTDEVSNNQLNNIREGQESIKRRDYYNNRDMFSIFGDTLGEFLSNLEDKKIEKYSGIIADEDFEKLKIDEKIEKIREGFYDALYKKQRGRK